MAITLRQIEYVVQVAKLGSISAACSQLRISQSSILAAIDIAEQTAGIRVFERRKGHGVVVTPAGQKFLVSARRFLSASADFYASLDELAHSGQHTIRVGCFSPLGALLIPPVVKRMAAEFGETEFILYEGDQVELRSWLIAGMLDVVVTYDIGEEYGSGITPICRVPAHALVRLDDELAKQETVTMDELSKRPLVLLDLPETRSLRETHVRDMLQVVRPDAPKMWRHDFVLAAEVFPHFVEEMELAGHQAAGFVDDAFIS